MPSLSPGDALPSSFVQVLPGAPTQSLQALTTYTFRWKRYIVYSSGCQLNFLRSPTELVQATTFEKELVAIKAEVGDGGKIAVATVGEVWILEPQTDSRNRVTWRKSLRLRRDVPEDEARALCWGSEGEILVGGSKQLSLYSTLPSSRNGTPASSPIDRAHVEERHALWSKVVSSPIQHAAFSPSAGLIVSCGERDRFVKIWRRLSFEEGLFDHAYLPHPSLVTHLEWRTPDPPQVEEEDLNITRVKSYSVRHEDESEILYTFCADGVLRIWKTGGQHDLEMLTLHSTIDLVMAIPQSPTLTVNGSAHQHKPARYAFLLPAGAISSANSAAIAKHQLDTISHSIEHLKEISSKHPDIVVTLDGHGRMSAWGIQSIGHKRRPSTPSGSSKHAYHIAHTEDVDIKIPDGSNALFATWLDGDVLHVLVHNFDGTVGWYQGGVEQFLSPSAVGKDRLGCVASWTGSQTMVEGVSSHDTTGRALTWSSSGDIAMWDVSAWQSFAMRQNFSHTAPLSSEGILDVITVGDSSAILCLTSSEMSLWSASGEPLAKAAVDIASLHCPRLIELSSSTSSNAGGLYFLVSADGHFSRLTLVIGRNTSTSRLSVDSAHTLPISESDDQHQTWANVCILQHPRNADWARLVGISKEGIILRRDVHSADLAKPTRTHAPVVFSSGLESLGLLEATSALVAVTSADHSKLMILDLEEGYLEYQQQLTEDVRAMRFNEPTSAVASRLLAVAHAQSVIVLAQGLYRASERADGGIWQQVKRFSLANIGLELTTIAWLPGEKLALAAGNGLLVSHSLTEEDTVDSQEADAQSTETSLNPAIPSTGPLLIWHPGFLQHMILQGYFDAVITIFEQLEQKLKYFSDGDDLPPTLDLDPLELVSSASRSISRSFDSDTSGSLAALLATTDLPRTSKSEQQRIQLLLNAVMFLQEHFQSLDANGLRYLFSWKLQILRLADENGHSTNAMPTNGDKPTLPTVPSMSWREIAFAYHSATQQPLLDILTTHYGKKLTWTTARQLGIPAWLRTTRAAQSEGSDLASLEQIFDALAQTAYRAEYPPDPSRAALFFLSLRKKATLQALWRVAVGNREQRSTMNFLKRDFSTEENKTAAKKNAYALMGKRRFEYAAAFFLLADDAASAVRILAGQCEDLPLAVAVARVYSGDESPIFKKFMEERMLSDAKKDGDRWALSWAYDVLGRRSEAARALGAPMAELQDPDSELMVRRWQQDDPLKMQLYAHLRDAPTVATGNKRTKIVGAARYEYQAVLRAARLLRRMGLWLPALELVKDWRFSHQENSHASEGAEEEFASNRISHEPETAPSMLDNFSDLSIKDEPDTTAQVPKSMLDDFDTPKSTAAPKSMLDDFGTFPFPPAADTAKNERETKAAELLAKMKAKKEATSKGGKAPEKEQKKEPTQFKEPEGNSILDSFGF